MSWANYKDKVRKYFPFSKTELNSFIMLVLVFAFIWSFTEWGTANFEFTTGLKNFVWSALIIAVIVFVHHSAQRLYGIFFGYRIEQKIWWAGLLAGILGVILSNGKVIILAASAMQAHFLPHHRLGEWRYGPGLFQIGLVAFAGPVASVVIAFILQLIAPSIFSGMFEFSLLFALYCIIPIPPLDGVHVFAASRIYGFVFIFALFTMLAFLLLYFIAQLSIIWSLILAIVIGFACWLVFDRMVG
jgi:hypothetical protein